MLRKALRLHHTTFSKVPLERRRFKYGSVSLFPSPEGSVAVVVSKKVIRGAVDRNRLQRRVRHAFLKVPKVTWAVAIYPNREALMADFSDVVEALVQVVRPR
jgi:ribonuclease P protein component